MRILFLDDSLERIKKVRPEFIGHSVVFVRNVDDALDVIRNDKFDLWCLDHDLGDTENAPSDEKSGFRVVQFLDEIDVDKHPLYVIIHSFNTEGSKLMLNAAKNISEKNNNSFQVVYAGFNSAYFNKILNQILK